MTTLVGRQLEHVYYNLIGPTAWQTIPGAMEGKIEALQLCFTDGTQAVVTTDEGGFRVMEGAKLDYSESWHLVTAELATPWQQVLRDPIEEARFDEPRRELALRFASGRWTVIHGARFDASRNALDRMTHELVVVHDPAYMRHFALGPYA